MYEEFNEKIARIGVAKDNIKTSLTNKGLSPSDNIEDYSALIDSIEAGSSNIHLFKDEEALKNSVNSKQGDIGVIYTDIKTKLANEMNVKRIGFPAKVVMDTAITTSGYGQVMGYNGKDYMNFMVDYDGTEVRLLDYGDDITEVQYTSTDGITYNKTSGPDYIEYSDYITVDDFEGLLDVLGNFMLSEEYYFKGLYTYSSYTERNRRKLINITTKEYTEDFIIPDECIGKDNGNNPAIMIVNTYHYDETLKANIVDTCTFYPASYIMGYSQYVRYDSVENKYYLGTTNTPSSTGENQFKYINYDFVSDIAEESLTSADPLKTTYGSTTYYMYEIPANSLIYCDSGTNNKCPIYTWNGSAWTSVSYAQEMQSIDCYKLSPTQLTLEKENELLPELIGYGNKGLVTGSEEVYNNLNTDLINKVILNKGNEIALTQAIYKGGLTPYCSLLVNDTVEESFDTTLFKKYLEVDRDVDAAGMYIYYTIANIEEDYLIGYTYYTSTQGQYIYHFKLSTGELLSKVSSNIKYNSQYAHPIVQNNKVYFSAWYSGSTMELAIYDIANKSSSTYSISGSSYFGGYCGLLTGVDSTGAIYIGTANGLYKSTNSSFTSWSKVLSCTAVLYTYNYTWETTSAKSKIWAFTHTGANPDILYLYNMNTKATKTITLDAYSTSISNKWLSVSTFDVLDKTYIYVYSTYYKMYKGYIIDNTDNSVTEWNIPLISSPICTTMYPKYDESTNSFWFNSGSDLYRYYIGKDEFVSYGISNCRDVDLSNLPNKLDILRVVDEKFSREYIKTANAKLLFEGDYLVYKGQCRNSDINNIFKESEN